MRDSCTLVIVWAKSQDSDNWFRINRYSSQHFEERKWREIECFVGIYLFVLVEWLEVGLHWVFFEIRGSLWAKNTQGEISRLEEPWDLLRDSNKSSYLKCRGVREVLDHTRKNSEKIGKCRDGFHVLHDLAD